MNSVITLCGIGMILTGIAIGYFVNLYLQLILVTIGIYKCIKSEGLGGLLPMIICTYCGIGLIIGNCIEYSSQLKSVFDILGSIILR